MAGRYKEMLSLVFAVLVVAGLAVLIAVLAMMHVFPSLQRANPPVPLTEAQKQAALQIIASDKSTALTDKQKTAALKSFQPIQPLTEEQKQAALQALYK